MKQNSLWQRIAKRHRFIQMSFCAVAAIVAGYGCGSLDNPYLFQGGDQSTQLPKDPNTTGGTTGGQQPGEEGCVVKLKDIVVTINTKTKDGGVVNGDPRKIATELSLRFTGNQVRLDGSEFPPTKLNVAGRELNVRQKDKTVANGTFDTNNGKIEMQGAVFEVKGIYTFPSAPLTTEPLTITGESVGDLNITGKKFDKETKKLTLVSGFKIAANDEVLGNLAPQLLGSAITMSIEATADQYPDPATCKGGGTDLVLSEVFKKADGSEVEDKLAEANVFQMGRVFVPELSDKPTENDQLFSTIKYFRIKNVGNKLLSGKIAAGNDFTVEPSGDIQLAAGQTLDVKVAFGGTTAVDPSKVTIEAKRDAQGSVQLGTNTIQIKGVLKKAAPELTVVDSLAKPISQVDFGVAPMPVDGEKETSQLNCFGKKKVSTITKTVSLTNTGVRPIENLEMSYRDDRNHAQDAAFLVQCAGFTSEFYALLKSTEKNARCAQDSYGRSYFSCSIPDRESKIHVDVLYRPLNASPLVNAEGKVVPDTGVVEWTGRGLTEANVLKMQAGISADRSDVLTLKKEGARIDIGSGGNIKVNLTYKPGSDAQKQVTANVTLLNSLNKKITIQEVVVEDSDIFKVELPASKEIPARDSSNPGTYNFKITFVPKEEDMKESMTAKTLAAKTTALKVKFFAEGSDASNASLFSANLVGTINDEAPLGYYKMYIEKIEAYIDDPANYTKRLGSLDFKRLVAKDGYTPPPQMEKFRSGYLYFRFDPVYVEENGVKKELPNIRKISVVPLQPFFQKEMPRRKDGSKDYNSVIKQLSEEERKTVMKLYSTQLTKYPTGTPELDDQRVPRCEGLTSEDFMKPYQDKKCSMFYFIFDGSGVYDHDTGHIIFTEILFRTINNYHKEVLSYQSTDGKGRAELDTERVTTWTTLNIDTDKINNYYPEVFKNKTEISLVDPSLNISASEIPLASDKFQKEVLGKYDCPTGPNGEPWQPWSWDNLDKPVVLGCYFTQDAPYYMKGIPVTPIGGSNDYSLVISSLTRFPPTGVDNTPFFADNSIMWAAAQGRLTRCEDTEADGICSNSRYQKPE